LGIVATALRLLKEGLRKNDIAIDDDGDNVAVLPQAEYFYCALSSVLSIVMTAR